MESVIATNVPTPTPDSDSSSFEKPTPTPDSDSTSFKKPTPTPDSDSSSFENRLRLPTPTPAENMRLHRLRLQTPTPTPQPWLYPSDILYIDNEYYINERFLWLLVICCTFSSISIWILLLFFIVNAVVSITIVQHLRLDYCKNFELAWKETIDKSKWKMSCF